MGWDEREFEVVASPAAVDVHEFVMVPMTVVLCVAWHHPKWSGREAGISAEGQSSK